MNIENSTSLARIASPRSKLFAPASLVFIVGCAALVLPTMFDVARDSWSMEQGGHGPLVLATGIWALWRELKTSNVERHRGALSLGLPLLAFFLGLFVISRITGIIVAQAFSMYGALITATYLLFGGALIRAVWFPLVYLAFTLPPPESFIVFVTQPIKIAISSWVVSLLSWAGYPVASSGVTIEIGQYQLLVAAACAGLNSIVSLTALCIFYVYLRHRSSARRFVIILLAAIPVAVISNFVRVLTLVLITYYFGDAVAQGFVHDFAGLLMFSVALLAIFGVDELASRFSRNSEGRPT